VVKNLKKRASCHEDHFPKTLFTLSQCMIAEDDGSEDLLSQSQMHIGKRDEVASVAQQQKRQNLNALMFLWLFVCCYFYGGRTYI
jgi:hypothetical protein